MTDATSSATPESAAPQPLSSAPTQTPSATSANPAGTAPDGKAAEPEPTDELVTTRHTVTLSDGQVLDYSATTGRLVLREAVSYTHLDVYKRQHPEMPRATWTNTTSETGRNVPVPRNAIGNGPTSRLTLSLIHISASSGPAMSRPAAWVEAAAAARVDGIPESSRSPAAHAAERSTTLAIRLSQNNSCLLYTSRCV